MAVINTNYLALVSQNNLTKSQSSLGQAIERLSSGLRINSAKDDAAGQAIANRFTANINGLTQAARNSNDGISIAQTTEGALNEINNNLQRIRQLSVQAANGSNSDSDRASIQAEIDQRLDEIDRVSNQTQFNNINILAKDNTLTVQVGTNDSETIDVNLRRIDRSTLGLDALDMTNQFVTQDANGNNNFTAISGAINGFDTVTTISNTITPSIAAGWSSFGAVAGPGFTPSAFAVDTTGNLLVKDTGTNYYSATYNPATGSITVGALAGASAAAASVAAGATHFDPAAGGGGQVALTDLNLDNVTGASGPVINAYYMGQHSTNGTVWYAAGSDGKFYDVASFDATTGTFTVNFGASYANAASANTGLGITGVAITAQQYLSQAYSAAVTLDYTTAATTLGVAVTDMAFVENADGDQFVQVDDGNGNFTYYAASFSAGGTVNVGASPTAINTAYDLTAVDGALTGTNELVQYAGQSGYFVRNTDGGNVSYYTANVSAGGTVNLADADGNATTNAADAKEIMVNPLDALDKALQQVDNLRSDLGAVQNRFESTIANLNNTINNLSAARSRIEDADYAVEVSNMTRAQILQQAGTAVLAQANQVPQTMLSLLG